MTDIRPLVGADLDWWAAMRADLYGGTAAAHRTEALAELGHLDRMAFGVFDGATPVGFCEVSVRSAADGAVTSPVGYLEGWYVAAGHRGRGAGRALLVAAGGWAASRGCQELASDARLDDRDAQDAHRSAGFDEVDRVVQYVKAIDADIPAPAARTELPDGVEVTLRDIDDGNLDDVLRLDVAPGQDRFVAPNGVSIAQAMFTPEGRMWAIYGGDVPVGFALLHEDHDRPRYYLWRFMIDRRYQRRGLGRQAMRLIVHHVRDLPDADRLLVSYVPLPGGPGEFYRSLGFVETGAVHGGEVEMALAL